MVIIGEDLEEAVSLTLGEGELVLGHVENDSLLNNFNHGNSVVDGFGE